MHTSIINVVMSRGYTHTMKTVFSIKEVLHKLQVNGRLWGEEGHSRLLLRGGRRGGGRGGGGGGGGGGGRRCGACGVFLIVIQDLQLDRTTGRITGQLWGTHDTFSLDSIIVQLMPSTLWGNIPPPIQVYHHIYNYY